jgi:hypothetical protein
LAPAEAHHKFKDIWLNVWEFLSQIGSYTVLTTWVILKCIFHLFDLRPKMGEPRSQLNTCKVMLEKLL